MRTLPYLSLVLYGLFDFDYFYVMLSHDVEIQKVIQAIFPLSKEAFEDLSRLFETITIDKNDYLLKEGDRPLHCYFLEEGVVRVYYNKDGNEYNKTFFVPGMFPTAITSLITGELSRISFQALTSCRVTRFSYPEFRALFEKHRDLESLLLRIMEIQWVKKEKHDIEMVTNDATQNYLIFRKEFGGLENVIQQYHIASYLGITPIQLSRIRAQLVKSN